MRLEHLTPAHVRRAIAVYMRRAWPTGVEGRPIVRPEELVGPEDLGALLERFERVTGGPGELRRYALRLGNYRYPFMKFVVQEHLVVGEFFFTIDTHDSLDIRPDSDDYDEWERLKAFNRELKHRIEEDWDEAALPTNTDLRALVEELARVEREGKKRRRLLVVDDEREVALGLSALLKARGYEVDLARDGSEALERLERDPLPDLVLLDYEMPQLDGEEVLRRLRRERRTARLPVLLATASTIELSRLHSVSGFLRKPYPRHVLFEMIGRLLAPEPPAEGGEPAATEGRPA